jgi:small GTP-binding protein
MATNGAPESWDEEPATVTSSFKAFNLDDLDDFVPSFVPQAAQPAYEEPVAPEPAAPAPKPEPVKPAAVSTSSAAKEKGPDSASPSPVLTRQSTDPAAAARAADKAAQEAALIEKEDAEYKEHLNIVFIGHVDAGKSTMGGHILYLTGMVDKRTMEKYEKEAKELGRESWFLSWALDANAEERAKVSSSFVCLVSFGLLTFLFQGKTVEYGRGYFETAKRRFTILDAPGHKNFVPSMISGASQADVAVLVISARKGEFETGFEKGGQTREHAMLVKTTGVKKIVVAVNKMDDPTVMWSKERWEQTSTLCVDAFTHHRSRRFPDTRKSSAKSSPSSKASASTPKPTSNVSLSLVSLAPTSRTAHPPLSAHTTKALPSLSFSTTWKSLVKQMALF